MCVLPRAILGGDEAVAQVAAAAAAEIRERLVKQEALRQSLTPYQRMVREIQERRHEWEHESDGVRRGFLEIMARRRAAAAAAAAQ